MRKLLTLFILLIFQPVFGIEILCKVEHKVDYSDPTYDYQWKDGQIINIRPDNFYIYEDGSINGEKTCKSFCVIQIPKVTYKKFTQLERRVLTHPKKGEIYEWEEGYDESLESRMRDYFIDFKYLMQNGYITLEQYESIYNKDIDHLPIVLDVNKQLIQALVREEAVHTRIPDPLVDQAEGTIDAGGTYTVGTAQTYADWSTAAADLPADIGAMTTPGDITLQGNTTEEIAESTDVTFTLDTDAYTLTLTVHDDHVHNGGAYGSGHREAFTDYDSFTVDETNSNTLQNCIIEKIAFDCTGTGNDGVKPNDAGDSGHIIVQQCVIKGDSNSDNGIFVFYNCENTIVRNNVVYGFTRTANFEDGNGISIYDEWNSYNYEVYNNTVGNCTVGIGDWSATPAGTVSVRNNICYDNTTDYYDANSGFDTNTKNVSKDSSGTADEDDWTESSDFTNEPSNDYRLTATGGADTVLDNGDDLSGIGSPEQFSDDIVGTTRDTWFCGASEYDTPAPAATGVWSPQLIVP